MEWFVNNKEDINVNQNKLSWNNIRTSKERSGISRVT